MGDAIRTIDFLDETYLNAAILAYIWTKTNGEVSHLHGNPGHRAFLCGNHRSIWRILCPAIWGELCFTIVNGPLQFTVLED